MSSPAVIPGSLISNLPVKLSDPALQDVTAGLLSLFGIKIPPEVTGRPIF